MRSTGCQHCRCQRCVWLIEKGAINCWLRTEVLPLFVHNKSSFGTRKGGTPQIRSCLKSLENIMGWSQNVQFYGRRGRLCRRHPICPACFQRLGGISHRDDYRHAWVIASCPTREFHPANSLALLQCVVKNIPFLQRSMEQKLMPPMLDGIRLRPSSSPLISCEVPSTASAASCLRWLPAVRVFRQEAESPPLKCPMLRSPGTSAGDSGSTRTTY